MAKMLPIIIGILIVTNVGVRGCSIPSKIEPTKNTTEKPSITTIKEPSSDSTDQPETHPSEEKGPKTYCLPYNGTIFVPRTEEDNKIWLEFIMMLYHKDNSFKEAWYPLFYHDEGETFYWVYDTITVGFL
ncbi:hypothetical protein Anas_08980 [Armadillidium nasatum]|uniref:Uncharacterized protein n=1 Tax=Armadillidium nasatum TaxID=96803 RepID=A0A5N5TIU3_9CRUS|nr:hypothetical protein Anas_08980 [Armadillidium nasatum]